MASRVRSRKEKAPSTRFRTRESSRASMSFDSVRYSPMSAPKISLSEEDWNKSPRAMMADTSSLALTILPLWAVA